MPNDAIAPTMIFLFMIHDPFRCPQLAWLLVSKRMKQRWLRLQLLSGANLMLAGGTAASDSSWLMDEVTWRLS
jgi:hypothetical protein